MNYAQYQSDTRVQITGTNVTVPTDPFGKLSYYLNCVSACVPGVIDDYLTNYRNFNYFTDKTKAEIYVIAALLTPNLLEGKAFGQVSVAQMNSIDPGNNNTFVNVYERQRLTMVDVDRERVIGLNLENTEITKTMLYTQSWINNYYWNPIAGIKNMLEHADQQTRVVYVQQPAITYESTNNYYRSVDNDGCCAPHIFVFVCSLLFSFIGFCCAVYSDERRNTPKCRNWGYVGVVLSIIITLIIINSNNGMIVI